MSRRLLPLALAVLALVLLPRAARPADDEDPVVQGRKTSEWLELLVKYRTAKPDSDEERDKNVRRRRVILDVLEVSGPKANNVLPEVFKTLKADPDDGVRAAAARWLGNTALKAKQAELD